MTHYKKLIAMLLTLSVAASGPARAAAPKLVCETLATFTIAASAIGLPTSGAQVTSAILNSEYCEIKGFILPVDAKAPKMEFEVNLPNAWNDKALQMGGGGYDGTLVTGLGGEGLQPSTIDTPLRRGYVTAGSDGGHKGGPGFDGTFGLDDEALLNYGQQSVKKVHDVVVEIAKARYGHAPRRFYFIGSSQGGHEALDAAARYPKDYDGVIANYPAYNVTLLHLGSLNLGKAVYAGGGAAWLSPAKTRLLTDAVRKACDPLDGVQDGIISNVAACNATFDLATVRRTLRCAAGADSGDSCLSDAQIAAVEKIASPYRPGFAIAGAEEYPRWALLEGSRFQVSNFGKRSQPSNPPTDADALTYNAGAATAKYIITRNPQLDPLTFDPLKWQVRTQEVGRILDVTDVDLTPFRRKGGKIILTHGTEDDFISPHNTDLYYEHHLAKQGQTAMDSFVRYYKVAGLSHGFGTFNAKFDGLTTLDQWVVQGRAPGMMIATDANPDKNGRTRPMCLYPLWPKFTAAAGASADDAANFTCVR